MFEVYISKSRRFFRIKKGELLKIVCSEVKAGPLQLKTLLDLNMYALVNGDPLLYLANYEYLEAFPTSQEAYEYIRMVTLMED